MSRAKSIDQCQFVFDSFFLRKRYVRGTEVIKINKEHQCVIVSRVAHFSSIADLIASFQW